MVQAVTASKSSGLYQFVAKRQIGVHTFGSLDSILAASFW
jgi:hypothetical protein